MTALVSASHDVPSMTDRVLVVDDHPGFRDAARRLLEQGAFEVVGEAADGASAIRETARLRPDVVLLDIGLSDMDGFEVARRLLAEAAPPAIILISTRDAEDFGGRVERAGVRGFIPKSMLSRARIEALTR